MHELGRLSPEEFSQSNRFPFCFVLNDVRSMANVGSAFRTADAFAAQMVVLQGITAQPPHRDINKTALGATESVPWHFFKEPKEAIDFLRHEGYQIFIIEQTTSSKQLNEIPWPHQKVAFVLGNEVEGVSQEWLEAADLAIEIPQFGSKHSLNVSVVAGIIAWQFVASKFA